MRTIIRVFTSQPNMSADGNRDILQVPLEELSRAEVDSRCRYLEDRMRALLVLLEPIQKNADSLLQINETLETELKTAKNIRVAHESLMNMTYRHEERMKQDVKGTRSGQESRIFRRHFSGLLTCLSLYRSD
jgi:regulator of replication initiation timing